MSQQCSAGGEPGQAGAVTNTHPSLAAAAAGLLLSSSSPDVSSLKKSSGRLVSAWKTLVLKNYSALPV